MLMDRKLAGRSVFRSLLIAPMMVAYAYVRGLLREEEVPSEIVKALADAAGAAPFTTIALILLMVVAFYFLIIRPQKKRQQAQQKTMSELNKNYGKNQVVWPKEAQTAQPMLGGK